MEQESTLNLEGKASTQSVKTYNNNSQIGSYVSTQVSVKQVTRSSNYDMNNRNVNYWQIKWMKHKMLLIKIIEGLIKISHHSGVQQNHNLIHYFANIFIVFKNYICYSLHNVTTMKAVYCYCFDNDSLPDTVDA